MCAGAILLARVAEVRFAAPSPKFGALGSQGDLFAMGRWNHRPVAKMEAADSQLAERSAELLRAYFSRKREK